jgi:ABC-2 type transport system permease protein
MKFHRIYAIILRHVLPTFRSFDRILNIFYWPVLNIVIWGLTSGWLQQQAKQSHILAMILIGQILWQIVFRVNIELAKNLLEELTSHNLVNLFSTPLTVSEWMVASMLLGIINMILVVICSVIAALLLYALNIFTLGFMLIPCMISLLISGWFIGFFICSLLIYWGLKAQDFVYSVGWIFAPFSAVYYPLTALSPHVQTIARALPTTYVFESMRQVVQTGSLDTDLLVKSFALNFAYLGVSLILFKYMFEKSRQKGLARLN